MKKTIILLAIYFLPIGQSSQAQIWSNMENFSPSNSTLIGGSSRFGHHNYNWSTYYMQYNNASYFCSINYYNTISPSPASHKTRMPDYFVVTDMKLLNDDQGFIGSYQSVGMHGKAYYNTTLNSFQIFQLPAVDVLTRIAFKKRMVEDTRPWQVKAFATGKKGKESNILEFYADGVGIFAPYYYASLPYNSATGDREIADDVLILDDKVVFSTRDTRTGHAPVNLRISDTNNALTSSGINKQWQFWLPSTQYVLGETRLLNLEEGYSFILAYIVYDKLDLAYYLCTNRIDLNDLLLLNNTIVSHAIKIEKECTNLVDMIYEPNVNTMVILLNGHDKSELYHIDPYSNLTYSIDMLDYPYGNLYSIDTIGDYSSHNISAYVAMGDSTFFFQDISNGIHIEESCLEKKEIIMNLQNAPEINSCLDPLIGNSDIKEYQCIEDTDEIFFGSETCIISPYNK